MILTELREHTRHLHERAERAVDLDSRLRSYTNYVSFLARLYGFYAPLERYLVDGGAYEAVGLDPVVRAKTPWLFEDLTHFGWNPTDIAALPTCPWEAGTSSAVGLGCMYVVEGATLGGRFILKEAGRRMGVGPASGGSFFAGYGERTGELWKEFCAALSARSGHTPHADLVRAAADTFSRYEAWLA